MLIEPSFVGCCATKMLLIFAAQGMQVQVWMGGQMSPIL